MDNISRRRSNDEDGSCTANSMYLSFDAESTMSSACYKTLEALTDISSLSALSIVDDQDDKHMNSTLENKQDSQLISPLKTVKKMDVMISGSPLRALPKNIMRQYKALSSTPSREQLMKTVDVTRGSDASRCIDLGVAFLGVEDEKPAFFPVLSKQELVRGDNKENSIPESIDGSTLSVSSSVEVTSLFDKKSNSVSTASSLTGDESEAAVSVIEKHSLNSVSTTGCMMSEKSADELKGVGVFNKDDLFAEQNKNITPKANGAVVMLDVAMENYQGGVLSMDTLDRTPKANIDHNGRIATIAEDEETPIELTPKYVVQKEIKEIQPTASVSGKPKIAVLTSRSLRRSICEPNLQTNKPSRISVSGNKRQSLLPVTNKKTAASVDAETEIPLLMSKMLKITNSSEKDIGTATSDKKVEGRDNKTQKSEVIPIVKKSLQATEKRRSLMPPTKGRTSLMSSTVGEKRPFNFTHRMSVVVKTTLNSPARKVARKTIFSATNSLTSQQRRSMVATKSTQTIRLNNIDTGIRKSMLPPNMKMNSKLTSNPMASINETTMPQQRKSMFPLAKQAEETKLKTPMPSSNVRSKVEPSFTCNVCKEKFRVKSLLDAHKRSHEGDIVTPTIKKPTVTTAPNANNNGGSSQSNQCKYCDKKFALVRALHIHLLQNCSKIPPSEKRKLEYTEMNHVEKARLPSVFHHANGTSSHVSSTQATPRGFLKQSPAKQIPKITVEFVKEKDFKKNTPDLPAHRAQGLNSNVNTTQAVAGSNHKQKKATAHSGVYRTPNKTVPCHICRLTFKSILDYTNHSLASHGTKTQQQDDDLNTDEVQMM